MERGARETEGRNRASSHRQSRSRGRETHHRGEVDGAAEELKTHLLVAERMDHVHLKR